MKDARRAGGSVKRYGIYWAPPADHPLWRAGCEWLGRDAESGAAHAASPHRAGPRRYGFHATLAAPFRLGDGSEAALHDAAAAFALTQRPVPLGLLQVTRLGSFIALCPAEKQPGIAVLESGCVHTFHRFRAPLSAAERGRRLRSRLTPHQIALMDEWGYPYVLDQFRLHMTLTGPVAADQIEAVARSLQQAYAPLADAPVTIDAISLVRQDGADARFRVVERFALTGGSSR